MLRYNGCSLPVSVFMICEYSNFLSRELKLKLEYIRNHYDVDENDYYIYDAIRQVTTSFSYND